MTDNPLRLLQITDPHLFADENGSLLGVNTLRSFTEVMQLAKQDILNTPPHLIMLTGDFSQDNSAKSYQRLVDAVAGLTVPITWIPGNHDDLPTLQQTFKQTNISMEKSFNFAAWHIILLNTHWPGNVAGHLKTTELNRLEKLLQTQPDKHTMIVLHHHAIPVGSHWIDELGVKNADDLLAIIKKHSQIRAVVCGHVHQASDTVKDGIRFISTPSTCVQFKSHSDGFAVDDLAPGYRWFNLHADGTIETDIVRLHNFNSGVDLTSQGY